MSSKSFYAITWACGTCNLFYNSALPRNRTLYICCTKCDSFVELYVCCGAAAQSSSGRPHSWGFQITHNGTPNLVGLLWMSDRHVAENSTWKQKTITNGNNLPSEIRTHNLSRRAALDLRLRSRGHWERNSLNLRDLITSKEETRKDTWPCEEGCQSEVRMEIYCISCVKHLIANKLGYSTIWHNK